MQHSPQNSLRPHSCHHDPLPALQLLHLHHADFGPPPPLDRGGATDAKNEVFLDFQVLRGER